jgi:hypothetical protein
MGIAIVVKFSIDSKYLITVSIDTDGEQTISLWEWMLGLEEPTCMYIKYFNNIRLYTT